MKQLPTQFKVSSEYTEATVTSLSFGELIKICGRKRKLNEQHMWPGSYLQKFEVYMYVIPVIEVD